MRIAAAGNTEVPAYLCLVEMGFFVEWDAQENSEAETWKAKKLGVELLANGPLELLGLAIIANMRDINWRASDEQIEGFMEYS